MNKMIKLICILAFLPCVAQAQGRWEAQVGVNRIDPQTSSKGLSAPSLPDTKIDVDAANAAIFTVRYAFTDDIGLEFYGGMPYRHDIRGAGSIAGVGKIADTRQISPTLMLQRQFQITHRLKPYVGVGFTYAYFYDERGSNILTGISNPGSSTATTVEIDNSTGISFQAGLKYFVYKNWFVNASVIKTIIDTKARLSTGQDIKVNLDPISTDLTVGYRF